MTQSAINKLRLQYVSVSVSLSTLRLLLLCCVVLCCVTARSLEMRGH